ncbi:MAG: cysteine desulfurase NifS [Clostridiales bacterium]|nr:MAG: cysteine desulfurase NifS [Clostridiales bacterium]
MIYLDNAATTRVYDEAVDIANKYMKDIYGNAGSLHSMGLMAEKALTTSRKIISTELNVNEKNIIFTSGATESNNLVFNSIKTLKNKNKIIISSIEHASVYMPALKLKEEGYNLVIIDTDSNGKVNINQLMEEVDENTALVSIIMVNNEISVIQDISEISKKLKSINYGGYFHTDATQGICKLKINIKDLDVDFLSASAHKFHGSKGVGFLYAKEPDKISPLFLGGKQEKDLRAGTENVPLITSMAKAFVISSKNLVDTYNKLTNYKNILKDYVENKDSIISTISNKVESSPYIYSIAYKGIKSEILLHSFESKGIAVSSGSACSSKSKKISRILNSIKLDDDYVDGVIRISFSRFTTENDIYSFIKVSDEVIESVKRTK